MGLDQYGYAVSQHPDNTDFSVSDDAKKAVMFSWRKHPNLEGWMEKLYNAKADAQGYEGETEFPSEIVAHIVGQPMSEDEIPEEIKKMATDQSEFQKIINAQQYIAAAASIGKKRVFNNQFIRLNVADLDQLEMHVKNKTLPKTTGFFFGEDSDDEYHEYDLKFIEIARDAIANGIDFYYCSSW